MKTHRETRILVVEDEVPMARAISDRLKAESFQVSLVKDGEKGLEMASKKDFDVIILDIAMPNVDGMQMMRRLRDLERQRERHTPIVIYTNMVPDEEIIEGVTQDRPTYYLSKTTHSLDYLVETIDQILKDV